MMLDEKLAIAAQLTGKNIKEDFSEVYTYLRIAEQKILERCYPFGYDCKTEIPYRYELLQCQIAAYLINKQGADGQTSHSENGVSRSYESGDVPESLLGQITPRGAIY